MAANSKPLLGGYCITALSLSLSLSMFIERYCMEAITQNDKLCVHRSTFHQSSWRGWDCHGPHHCPWWAVLIRHVATFCQVVIREKALLFHFYKKKAFCTRANTGQINILHLFEHLLALGWISWVRFVENMKVKICVPVLYFSNLCKGGERKLSSLSKAPTNYFWDSC